MLPVDRLLFSNLLQFSFCHPSFWIHSVETPGRDAKVLPFPKYRSSRPESRTKAVNDRDIEICCISGQTYSHK